MADTYSIADWDKLYETHDTRRSAMPLRWIKMRCQHSGSGYSKIAAHPQCERVFCGFVLSAEVAATCKPRGTLVDGDGKPLTPTAMEFKTHFPAEVFEVAWPALVEIGWMNVSRAARPPAGDGMVGMPAAKARRVRKTLPPDEQAYSGGWVWGRWVDINRLKGNPDPAPVGPDVKAAAQLSKAVKREEIVCILEAYLDDADFFAAKQGHPLRLLPGRVNAYRNTAAPGEPEMSDEGLKAAQEAEREIAEEGKK